MVQVIAVFTPFWYRVKITVPEVLPLPETTTERLLRGPPTVTVSRQFAVFAFGVHGPSTEPYNPEVLAATV